MFTDSRPTLESIASSKQVERKLMRNCVSSLKEDLNENRVSSFSWVDGDNMIADVLTKERKEHSDFSIMLLEGKLKIGSNADNLVYYDGIEIKIDNIRGK